MELATTALLGDTNRKHTKLSIGNTAALPRIPSNGFPKDTEDDFIRCARVGHVAVAIDFLRTALTNDMLGTLPIYYAMSFAPSYNAKEPRNAVNIDDH